MGEMRETIRSNLERYISESGYSQKEIAEKLGVSKSSVTNWVKGKNSPDVELVVPLCRLLNITIRDFYGESDADRQKEKPPAQSGELSDKDIQLIKWFRSLPPEKQKAILIAQDGPADTAD